MRIPIVFLFLATMAGADDAVTLRAGRDFDLTADPGSPEWSDAPALTFGHGRYGEEISGHRTEVRSRWTPTHLHLLFICQYGNLYLKPGPPAEGETNELWNWDVAEVFIGWDFENIRSYKEFEISPRGEWVDLDIGPPSDSKHKLAWEWNSGFESKARIDAERKVWYGEMRIPFSAIAPWRPEAGRILRVNFYRAQGRPRQFLAWRPVGQDSFHQPESFGILTLIE